MEVDLLFLGFIHAGAGVHLQDRPDANHRRPSSPWWCGSNTGPSEGWHAALSTTKEKANGLSGTSTFLRVSPSVDEGPVPERFWATGPSEPPSLAAG